MEITEQHKRIFHGLVCAYCNIETELVDSIEIYKTKSYGNAYLCRQCGAYVGCHKGKTEALGRVANAELRALKSKTHEHFDKLWKGGKMKRKEAYEALSKFLGIPFTYTHIGMFSPETCKKATDWAKRRFVNLESKH